jgi:hypothetical protein
MSTGLGYRWRSGIASSLEGGHRLAPGLAAGSRHRWSAISEFEATQTLAPATEPRAFLRLRRCIRRLPIASIRPTNLRAILCDEIKAIALAAEGIACRVALQDQNRHDDRKADSCDRCDHTFEPVRRHRCISGLGTGKSLISINEPLAGRACNYKQRRTEFHS